MEWVFQQLLIHTLLNIGIHGLHQESSHYISMHFQLAAAAVSLSRSDRLP
jgi:hypothetical protein